MKSFELQTAIDRAKQAVMDISYLDADQLMFARRIINDSISELISQALDDELAKEEEVKDVL